MVRSMGDMALDKGSEGLAESALLVFCEKKLEITGCRISETTVAPVHYYADAGATLARRGSTR